MRGSRPLGRSTPQDVAPSNPADNPIGYQASDSEDRAREERQDNQLGGARLVRTNFAPPEDHGQRDREEDREAQELALLGCRDRWHTLSPWQVAGAAAEDSIELLVGRPAAKARVATATPRHALPPSAAVYGRPLPSRDNPHRSWCVAEPDRRQQRGATGQRPANPANGRLHPENSRARSRVTCTEGGWVAHVLVNRTTSLRFSSAAGGKDRPAVFGVVDQLAQDDPHRAVLGSAPTPPMRHGRPSGIGEDLMLTG